MENTKTLEQRLNDLAETEEVITATTTEKEKALEDLGLELIEEETEDTIFINAEFGEELTASVCGFVSQIEHDIDDPIHVKILSNGGSIDSLFAIMDLLEPTGRPIYTYCYGYAKSCGMILLCMGDRREVGKWSEVMYHTIMTNPQRYMNKKDTILLAKDMDKMQDKINNFIIERTKITKKQLKKYEDKDWEMDRDECIAWGVDNSYEYDKYVLELLK